MLDRSQPRCSNLCTTAPRALTAAPENRPFLTERGTLRPSPSPPIAEVSSPFFRSVQRTNHNISAALSEHAFGCCRSPPRTPMHLSAPIGELLPPIMLPVSCAERSGVDKIGRSYYVTAETAAAPIGCCSHLLLSAGATETRRNWPTQHP